MIWIALNAAGAVLIAIPDTGPRVFTFSGQHGPGTIDSIGVTLILVGFGVLLSKVYRGRRTLTQRLAGRLPIAVGLAFLAGLGTGLLLAGVFTDFWWWWLVGALALQFFWLAVWYYARVS